MSHPHRRRHRPARLAERDHQRHLRGCDRWRSGRRFRVLTIQLISHKLEWQRTCARLAELADYADALAASMHRLDARLQQLHDRTPALYSVAPRDRHQLRS